MNKIKFFLAVSLILIGVISRFFLANYVGIPNFEPITAIILLSAVFLGGIWTFVVPLSIIAIKDVIMGNNSVLFFTWSAFAIIGVFGCLFKVSPFEKGGARGILGITGIGIISSIFFFLYTNFGWWLVSNMYPHTIDGLIQCYIMGLPFFKNNLIGNMIFVPLFTGAVLFVNFSVKNKIWNSKELKAIGLKKF